MTLYGDQKGLEFFEASAKENINVKNVFDRLVDIICDKMSDNIDNNPGVVGGTSKGNRLTDKPQQQQQNQQGQCQC
uniref:Ras-related protein Rab-3 n=1 Tax=Schistosoma haematobium TaxID=6185 RepID=A0A095A1I5_SCHHA